MDTYDDPVDEMMTQIREAINQPEVRETWQELTEVDKVNVNTQERLASIIGGTVLMLYGLLRLFSAAGWGAIAAGGYLLYRGLTGYCPAYRALGVNSLTIFEQQQLEAGEEFAAQKDSVAYTTAPASTLAPDDKVDENLWETFPASDPPATY